MGFISHVHPPHGGVVLKASEIVPGFSSLELGHGLLACAELQLVYAVPLHKLGKDAPSWWKKLEKTSPLGERHPTPKTVAQKAMDFLSF